MFKCNRSLADLADLLSAVDREAETLAEAMNAKIEALACDGFWTLSITYNKASGDDNGWKARFCRDYETLEDLRKELSLFSIAAKIMTGEEV